MNSGNLPSRPDVDQLRRKAKELLAAASDGEPAALARIRAVDERVILASAQLVIARDHGFGSWPDLVAATRQGPGGSADPEQRRQSAGAWLAVRYPGPDDEHYLIQMQQLPASGRRLGLVLISPTLRAHTVDEVYDLAAELCIARDLVFWLGPDTATPPGPWPLPDPDRVQDTAVDGSTHDRATQQRRPTLEQRGLTQERLEAAGSVAGQIARGQIQTAPDVLAVARAEDVCVSLLRISPGSGTSAEDLGLVLLWWRRDGRWRPTGTATRTDQLPAHRVLEAGSPRPRGPHGKTWHHVVGHTATPDEPLTMRLGHRTAQISIGIDGYFLGVMENTTDDHHQATIDELPDPEPTENHPDDNPQMDSRQ